MTTRLFAITVSYCEPEVLAHGLVRFNMTAGMLPWKYVVVDHLFPINPLVNSIMVNKLATLVDAEVVKPSVNTGGAGGFNFGMKALPDLRDEDLIVGMDPDSNPITYGWLPAMVKTMEAGKDLMSVSLMHEHIVQRNWEVEFIGGNRVAFLPHPEMMNLSMWRVGAIRDGLKQSGFYGHTERMMWAPKKNAYLYDFRETLCPIQHPASYNTWKRRHAFDGYTKNYDDFIKEFPNE